jgi:nitroreductase
VKNKIGLTKELLPEIKQRWSGRSFRDDMLSEEHLEQLLEAARWAPSCYNEQPWQFLVTRKGTESFLKLHSSLSEGNKAWAGNAPILLVAFARKNFSHNGKENKHAWHDVGLAIGQLSIQAAALGINIHQMAGFDPEPVIRDFNVPQDWEAVTINAIGYRGEADSLEGILKEKELAPQTRRDISEIIFMDHIKTSV